MGFGKKRDKSDSHKLSKPELSKVKQAKLVSDEKAREELIINRIVGILETTDAGCCPIEHIRKKMSKVNGIESFIKMCVNQNDFILHRGWLYNRQWSIEDLNEISNNKIVIDDFLDDNLKTDKDLLIKLSALYKRENEPIKITWFETLIKRGVLNMTEKQLYNSLERLMRAGKIYEPKIGEFAPTYDNIKLSK